MHTPATTLHCSPQGLIQPVKPTPIYEGEPDWASPKELARLAFWNPALGTLTHLYRARNMGTGELIDIQAPEYQAARDYAGLHWPGAQIACWMAED